MQMMISYEVEKIKKRNMATKNALGNIIILSV